MNIDNPPILTRFFPILLPFFKSTKLNIKPILLTKGFIVKQLKVDREIIKKISNIIRKIYLLTQIILSKKKNTYKFMHILKTLLIEF